MAEGTNLAAGFTMGAANMLGFEATKIRQMKKQRLNKLK
jgi:hypothetical protein